MSGNAFVRCGTQEPEPAPVRLRAGALSADLVNGNLRTIRFQGIEVLRAIAYVVRDRDWGTYEPALSDLSIEQSASGFAVTYTARCEGPAGSRLMFQASINGSSGGTLSFDVTALPESDFETNRCGFCILHPIVGVAGSPVTVEQVDGNVIATKLPELIEPWQPFKNMRAITHEIRPGLRAECRMEGDVFEMEDQRNWSDASYKTYVRPLELPWPYTLAAGRPVRQQVSLRLHGDTGPQPGSVTIANDPVRLELGKDGPKLPEIGVVVYPGEVEGALANLTLLSGLGPQRLLFHFDPTAGHGSDVLQAYAALAAAYPCATTLECVVPCQKDPAAELSAVAAMVRAAGLKLSAIAVSPSVDRQSTPPGSRWPECPPLEDVYAAARRAFPGLRLGGGMFSYFTELNRKRVPAQRLDFVTHCTCPIVHAADDLSVMQSLEALPFITGSARALFGGKPYRIGPSTIAMRQNPYGSATKANPNRQRIAMANRDPRHGGLFAAAWTIGYAARVAGAGLEQLTPSGFAGPFGVLAEDGEPVPKGRVRPIFHAVRALREIAGFTHVATRTGIEDRLVALAGRCTDGRLVLWLANLTPADMAVDVSALGFGAGRVLQVFDEETVVAASGQAVPEAPLGLRPIRLAPYAITRIG